MHTLHLVSHTHWDREWYLTFQQFRLKLVHLIDGLLEILESDPAYKHYMLDGQAIVLEDYLAIRPEREEALRRFIRSGRIVIGPWHILPDEFLVSPEATIRNLLQGERTCRRFGPRMEIGYIPDPFGHIGQMPQILIGFGIQSACVQRGLSDEPCEFWWQAPDGSRVFMAYQRDGYGNAASLPTADKDKFTSEVRRLRDHLLPHAASPHILLMHGTDHMEPPPDTVEAINATRGKLDGDILVHSTLTDYIAAAKASIETGQLPVVRGELRDPRRSHLLPGVLSTRMWIKQRNRRCETLLEKWAEPFSTLAERAAESNSSLSLARKAPIVHAAWHLLMENHPHDSICGCSIDQVHEEMRVRFDQVEQIGEEITRQSLEILAASVDTGSPIESLKSAILVFNPSSVRRTDIVAATVDLPPEVDHFDLVDEIGNPLPHQILGLGSRELVNMSLNARELQALLGNVSDGRAAGMTIHKIQIRQEGSHVFIEAVMAQGGEPDLVDWKEGLKVIQDCFTDPSIKTYNVRGRSPSAIQVMFTAPDVPALGYRTFRVQAKPGRSQPARLNPWLRLLIPLAGSLTRSRLTKGWIARLSRPAASRPPYRIENERFLVEAKNDGTITIVDKTNGAAYTGLNRFVDGGDCGDEYNYSPPDRDLTCIPRLKCVAIRRGPVQQSLEVNLELRTPEGLAPDRSSRSRENTVIPIISSVTLTNGVPRVDVRTGIDNRARDHRLRVHFPAPFPVTAADHDGHFEIVRRPTGVPKFDDSWIEQPRPEVPQRAFTDISDGKLGLMIANRGLPEVEVLKNRDGNGEIAVTLLRCVGGLSRYDFSTRKGHAGPVYETPGAQMPGNWVFEYSIIPHAGGEALTSYHHAYAFETPLRAISTSIHGGTLPAAGSLISVEPATFVISAVKEAEDGSGWLVRGYNLTGEAGNVKIKPWRVFKRIERVNLAEIRISSLDPATDGSVTFPVKGYEIATVKFSD